MKILVTGGSGFVGRNLIPKLLKKHDVVNLDIVELEDLRHNGNLKTVLIDITDLESLNKTFKGELKDTDAVIHLAALSRENMSNEVPDQYFNVNIGGTYNLLKSIAGTNVKKFVFASSFLAYGNHKLDVVDENQPLFPSSVYAATKVAGEALVKTFSQQNGFDYVIFRKCNIYGDNDPQKRIIDLFIERAKENKDLILFGDKILDFVSVGDVTDAYVSAIDFDGSETFNIGSGKGRPIKDIATLIKSLTNSKSNIVRREPNRGDLMHFIADISKARKLLNYNPRGSLDDFIKKMIR